MAREVLGDVARVQFRAAVDRLTVTLDDDRDLHCGSWSGSAGPGLSPDAARLPASRASRRCVDGAASAGTLEAFDVITGWRRDSVIGVNGPRDDARVRHVRRTRTCNRFDVTAGSARDAPSIVADACWRILTGVGATLVGRAARRRRLLALGPPSVVIAILRSVDRRRRAPDPRTDILPGSRGWLDCRVRP